MKILVIFMIFLISFTSNVYAQIYSFRDEKAKMYFSNCPVDERYRTGKVYADISYEPRISVNEYRPGSLVKKAWDNYEETKNKRSLAAGELDAATDILNSAIAAQSGISPPPRQRRPNVTVINPAPPPPPPVIVPQPIIHNWSLPKSP